MSPTFSVIIPLYNKGRYIDATLASVTAQTFADMEVIVIDDGSTDDGPARVATHASADTRLRLLRQPNGGVSAARNAGLRAARGEWVAFLDADDTWMPTYLAEMHALARRHPEAGLCACARQGRRIPTLPEECVVSDAAAWGVIYWTGTTMARRTLFATAGLFREGISRGEDRDMWLRLGLHAPTAFLNRELARYEEHAAGSLTDLVPLCHEFPYWEWYDLPRRYPTLRHINPALPATYRDSIRRYATNQLMQLANAHFMAGHRKDALRVLLRCRGMSDMRARLQLLRRILTQW